MQNGDTLVVVDFTLISRILYMLKTDFFHLACQNKVDLICGDLVYSIFRMWWQLVRPREIIFKSSATIFLAECTRQFWPLKKPEWSETDMTPFFEKCVRSGGRSH